MRGNTLAVLLVLAGVMIISGCVAVPAEPEAKTCAQPCGPGMTQAAYPDCRCFPNIVTGTSYPADPGLDPQPAQPTTPAVPPVVQPAVHQNYVVAIRNSAYHPDNITINAGDSITWINYDSPPHTASSEAYDGFTTQTIMQGQNATITFPNAGAYPYWNQLYPLTKGTIIVK